MKICRMTGMASRGRLAQRRRIDRHRPPAQHGLPFLAHHALESSLADLPAAFVGRQEDQADAILAGRGQRDAELAALLAEKRVRHLHENAGAVAGVLLAAAGAAVLQVNEDLQRIADDVVRLAVLEIDDEADAAGIVLVARIVQALLVRESVAESCHFFLLACSHAGVAVVSPVPVSGHAWPLC